MNRVSMEKNGNMKITSMHLYPPKTECDCPSGKGIKNSHIRYPSYGGTRKKSYCNEGRIYFNLSKSIQSAAELKAFKSAAMGAT